MSTNRKRTVRKNVYFSAVEWDRIVRRMRSTNTKNFSQYAREVLTSGRVEVVYRPDTDHALIGQIGRIGNNINQIARWANTESQITEELSIKTLDLLTEVHRLIADGYASKDGDNQNSASKDNA